jgi:flagellar hook-basal body complex protein FliE
MNPISLNSGVYSPFANMRPELPTRKPADLIDGQSNDLASPSLPSTGASGVQPTGFDNLLGNFVKEVNGKQMAAGDSVTGLLSGQNVSLHEAMISMEEASVSFQLMVEVRNKLLEGYQELMRMQV